MNYDDVLPVATIGQGTWQMERDDRKAAIVALQRGMDLGLWHIDTAELYGSGRVETLVAEAIRGRRDRVFLASKVMPSNASRAGTIAACEQSLQRLGCEYLDLYMLHWPGEHPLAETFRAFEELAQSGKIRRYGVSNFDVDELDEALALCGPGKLACNQVLYHLGERSIEHRVIPWCQKHQVPVVAYSPFGSGRFPAPASAGGKALASVALAHGATARQVALAFVTRLPWVVTIPKASDAAHAEDNAGALGLRLTSDEIAIIDRAFPRGPDSALPTL
jgi:diketogulonate reductase-like aldo/keto reductase